MDKRRAGLVVNFAAKRNLSIRTTPAGRSFERSDHVEQKKKYSFYRDSPDVNRVRLQYVFAAKGARLRAYSDP
jgi:hypothetical protein